MPYPLRQLPFCGSFPSRQPASLPLCPPAICVSVASFASSFRFRLTCKATRSDPINPLTVCLRSSHSPITPPIPIPAGFIFPLVASYPTHIYFPFKCAFFADFIASQWQFNERICRRHLPSHTLLHIDHINRIYSMSAPLLLGTLFFLNFKYPNILHSHTRRSGSRWTARKHFGAHFRRKMAAEMPKGQQRTRW